MAGLVLAAALVGLAASFALAAAADAGPAQTTTTTEPPPPTEPPPTDPPTEPPPAPRPAPIAFGVTVGGVSVGGMSPSEAAEAVKKAYARPLPLVVSDTRTIRLAPGAVGARPNFPKAILRARKARPGRIVPLDVALSVERIRTYVERLADDLDREPADAKIVLRGIRPRAVEAHEGRHLKRLPNSRAIRFAIKRNTRTAIPLAWDVRKPKVLSVDYDGAIVILRSSNRLLYYDKVKLVRRFGVATGQAAYPTPLGDYEIVNMQRNPWWYPPPSPWAAASDPVPPGPGNPLGTRWMGISAPYVGIHGTPDAASIGYSASHGCIRMRISDAEWLFRHVEIGLPVFIVAR